MLLTATMILVLALLLYGLWDFLWHIATSLAVALLVYQAWPWLSQMQWDNLMISWLQQIHLPQVSATNTPSGRLYVSPQRTDESRIHFEELAKRSIGVLIRDRFFVPKTGRERMFSFGKEGAGIWLTTKSRTDTSVFRKGT